MSLFYHHYIKGITKVSIPEGWEPSHSNIYKYGKCKNFVFFKYYTSRDYYYVPDTNRKTPFMWKDDRIKQQGTRLKGDESYTVACLLK